MSAEIVLFKETRALAGLAAQPPDAVWFASITGWPL